MRVQADPAKLAARQMDLEEVRNALASGSVNLPAGSLYGYSKAYTVQSNSQLTSAPAIRAADRQLQQRQPGASGRIGQSARQRQRRQNALLDQQP